MNLFFSGVCRGIRSSIHSRQCYHDAQSYGDEGHDQRDRSIAANGLSSFPSLGKRAHFIPILSSTDLIISPFAMKRAMSSVFLI